MNREEFIKTFPQFEDHLAKHEAEHGQLQKVMSVVFNDGRSVILYRFEQSFMLSCWNPNNGEAEREFQACLSPEAMLALMGLYGLMKEQSDVDALHEQIKDETPDDACEFCNGIKEHTSDCSRGVVTGNSE